MLPAISQSIGKCAIAPGMLPNTFPIATWFKITKVVNKTSATRKAKITKIATSLSVLI